MDCINDLLLCIWLSFRIQGCATILPDWRLFAPLVLFSLFWPSSGRGDFINFSMEGHQWGVIQWQR